MTCGRNISLPWLALLALGLFSCTPGRNDLPPGESGEDGGRRYFSLRVRSTGDDGLDAGDYADGTDFEHAVDLSGRSEHVIIFFDADWRYYGYSLLEFDRMSAQGSTSEDFPHEAAYVGFLRPSDTHEIYAMPEYGVLLVNAFHVSDALDALAGDASAGIGDVLALVDASSGTHTPGRSGNYFTMTSSAYLVKDGDGWKHSIAFRIDKEKVFDNRAQAVVSPAATAVVERMCAKFSLHLSGTVGGKGTEYRPDGGRAQVIVCEYIDGQPNYSNRNWTCSVTAWGINKSEPASYWFRNIISDEAADVSSYPFSYGADINAAGRPFFNGWNQPSFHRAKWAVDPHYASGVYPTQFRPAVDNPLTDYYGRQDAPSLSYLSYNELSTDLSALDSEDGAVLYAAENTFPDTRLAGLWQHDLAASEVVIGARMHIDRIDESRPGYDLYRNRIGVFYPSVRDFAEYFISTVNMQLSSQSSMSYRYYDWTDPDNNTGTQMRDFKLDYGDYRLYYLDKPLTAEVMAGSSRCTMPATIENGDGKVIPWLNGMYIGRRAKNPETYEEVGDIQRLDIQPNAFKSLIYDWVGAFDHFCEGRMCYSVPIRYRASQEKVESNAYKPAVGDYGVVRNAWYTFVVDAINGLGTPVDDPGQAIIPYEASLENSILMDMHVLDWHRFSTDVMLPDHLK